MVLRQCPCGKSFRAKPCIVAMGEAKYCSKSCASQGLKRGKTVECHACGMLVYRSPSQLSGSKTGTYFCGPGCRSRWNEKVMPAAEQHPNWKGGKSNYRSRAFVKYGKQCASPSCILRQHGVSVASKMLDVDHIDNNRSNNEIENLQVLCVWCHALKTREQWPDD